jgi:hypothetical protein
MLLGCCHCDFTGLPQTSSEGSSSELDSTAEDSISVGEYPPCGMCVGGVLPQRFLLTWPYDGTGGTSRPCCDEYAGQDEYLLRFWGSYTLSATTCEYRSDERNLVRTNGNCVTFESEPRVRMGFSARLFAGAVDVTAWVRIQSRVQFGFGSGLIVLDYAGLIGQVPTNCVQSFTLPLSGNDWKATDGTSSLTDPPCDYYTQTIPPTVTLQPA